MKGTTRNNCGGEGGREREREREKERERERERERKRERETHTQIINTHHHSSHVSNMHPFDDQEAFCHHEVCTGPIPCKLVPLVTIPESIISTFHHIIRLWALAQGLRAYHKLHVYMCAQLSIK